MSIQTPSPDEIFKVWLNKLDDKTLSKYFKMKNVPLSRKNISAAEFVKKVNKYALFIVKMELPAETKRKTKREKVLKIEGMLFYDHPIEKDVPIFKSLKLVKCEKCNGSGYLACKSCGGRGYITCVKCKGRGEIKCDKCNGRGEIEITIKVEVEEGKRVNKKLKIKCPKCHGKGSVKCDKCGGLGKIKCPDCDGSGREICKECGGVGNIATYEVGKIRAKKRIDTKILFSEEIKKEYREEIIQNLERAESIDLTKTQLDEKILAERLGYMSTQIKKLLDRTKKFIKELEKSKDKKLLMPIMVYPVIFLKIETPKVKNIHVIGIGSKEKYIVSQI